MAQPQSPDEGRPSYWLKPGTIGSDPMRYGTAVHLAFDDWLSNQTCPVRKAETIYGDGAIGTFECENGHALRLELRP